MTISMLMSLIPGGIFMFSAARLLQGYFYAAGYNAVYVIFIEYLPKKKRAMVAPFIGHLVKELINPTVFIQTWPADFPQFSSV